MVVYDTFESLIATNWFELKIKVIWIVQDARWSWNYFKKKSTIIINAGKSCSDPKYFEISLSGNKKNNNKGE